MRASQLTALTLRVLPFLRWPRPDARVLQHEAMAAITIAMVMIPQAVAYAALAGMPLETGLYAALLPALVAALWGGTARLSVGPTALTCLLISASLAGTLTPGSTEWIQHAVWLGLLAGGIQLGMGAFQLGWLLNIVSAPVLHGFTQAAALLIIASQLPALAGLHHLKGLTLDGVSIQGPELLFGVAGITTLWAFRKFLPRWPGVVSVVIGSAVLSYLTGFASQGNAVVGNLPQGLPSLSLPGMPPWSSLSGLIVPAMVIALVSFLETASSAKIQTQADGVQWNDNQDLIGQGLAKIASALTGSFATSTSFSRSAISTYSGSRSGWSVIMMVAIVTLTLLFFTPFLFHIPMAVLAAVVVVAVSSILEPARFVSLWRISPTEGMTSLATFALMLVTAPRIYWGVLAGVMLGLTHFLYQRLHPRIIEVGLHPDGSLRDRHLWKLAPIAPQTCALRMDAELDFAAASSFERHIHEFLTAHPGTVHVCLFFQAVNRIDATGAEVFASISQALARKGVALHISGMKLPVETVLRSAGLLDSSHSIHLYRTDAEALEHFARSQAPG